MKNIGINVFKLQNDAFSRRRTPHRLVFLAGFWTRVNPDYFCQLLSEQIKKIIRKDPKRFVIYGT